MKTMTINGREFEVTRPRKEVKPFTGTFASENAIYSHYERPSTSKVQIWESWLHWAQNVDGMVSFEITGASCMQFSIGGLYVDETANKYNIRITKDHNYAVIVR